MKRNDPGHVETDKELAKLEKQISKEYTQAYKDVKKKFEKYMKDFARKDKEKRELVKSGKIPQEEYIEWRKNQLLVGQRWEEMRDALAKDITNTQRIANSMTKEFLPDAYAINHNYGTFEVEKGSHINTSYTLYDRDTVNRLIRDNPKLLPAPKVDIPKAQLWNRRKLTSAITQGVLQGEAIPAIAKRLMTVTDMSKAAAIRNARTMTTSAECAGRIDSYKRAESIGIDMKQAWVATLDGRTRHEHRLLDGQIRPVGEPFEVEGQKIMYPGDPAAEPYLVYNCRCTIIALVKGTSLENGIGDYPRILDPKLGDMTYEEWKHAHEVIQEQEKPKDNSDIIERMRTHKIFDGLQEEDRENILESIKYGDRAYAERALQSMDNVHVNWYVQDYKEVSDYTFNSGVINMRLQEKDNGKINPRTFWHEMGHFIDDESVSHSGITKEITVNYGDSEKTRTLHGATSIINNSNQFGKCVDNDINNFLKRNNLSDDYESVNGGWIKRKLDGYILDPSNAGDLYSKDANRISKAMEVEWQKVTGRYKANHYLESLGMPKEVKMEEYGYFYTTPKRQKVKWKWNSKKSESEYREKQLEYLDKKDEFWSKHDINEVYKEIDRLTEIAEKNEREAGGATDTFDGLMYGLPNACITMGAHNAQYHFESASRRIQEGVANVHECEIRNNDISRQLMNRLCPETYNLIKGALDIGT